jgi:DNA-directed RNA polymerase specialized sigma24 family protein
MPLTQASIAPRAASFGASPRGIFVADQWTFEELILAVRARDESAAAELVRRFEPKIARAVRVPMQRLRLYRLLDPADITQTVLARFFAHATAGDFQLHGPHQVQKLLLTMARKQVLSEARRYLASRRDNRRLDESYSEEKLNTLVDRNPSPSMVAMVNELLREMYRLFTPQERFVADQRSLGRSWEDLATEVGGSAEGQRKKFERALERVARHLGVDAR